MFAINDKRTVNGAKKSKYTWFFKIYQEGQRPKMMAISYRYCSDGYRRFLERSHSDDTQGDSINAADYFRRKMNKLSSEGFKWNEFDVSWNTDLNSEKFTLETSETFDAMFLFCEQNKLNGKLPVITVRKKEPESRTSNAIFSYLS